MTISPVLDPEVETGVEKETAKVSELKIPTSLRPKPRTVREAIFEGTRIFSPTLPTRRSDPSFG
jgi:hypothetical protein